MSTTTLSPAERLKHAILRSHDTVSYDAKKCLLWLLDQYEREQRPLVICFGNNEPETLGQAAAYSAHDMHSCNGTTHLNGLEKETGLFLFSGCGGGAAKFANGTNKGWFVGVNEGSQFKDIGRIHVIAPDYEAIARVVLPPDTVAPTRRETPPTPGPA